MLIASAASSLGAATLYLYGFALAPHWPILAFLWLATFGFYCLHDWVTKRRLPFAPAAPSLRLHFWQHYGYFMLAPMGLAAMAMGWIAFHHFHRHHLVQGLVLVVLSLLYTLPILPFQGLKRWKDHALLKILVLSGVWTLATTAFLFPPGQPAPGWSFQASRWLFILLLCIPFDVRDAATDRAQMRRTLPEILGRGRLAGYLAAITLAAGILQFVSLAQLQQSSCIQALLALHLLLTAGLARYTLAHTQKEHLFLLLDIQLMVQATIIGLCAWLA